MSYTDGIIWQLSAETQDEAAPADLFTVHFPSGCMVYDLVLIQTEAATNAAPVVALQVADSATGTLTELLTVTPSATAAANTRTKADTSRFPVAVPPGGRAVVRHKTAGAATGAYIAALAFRHDGLATRATASSPLVEVSA